MAKAAQVKEPGQEDLLKDVAPPNPEQTVNKEVDAKPEGEVEIKLDEAEDPSIALQKQIDALRKSEEIQKTRAEKYRQEAEEARQASQQHQTEAGKSRKEVLQSQFDSVSTALAASQAEVESAKRDIRTAKANGDTEVEIEAFERLSRAQANITKLEDGKNEIEYRLKQPDPEPKQQAMPPRVQRWVSRHQDLFNNPRTFDQIKANHWVLIQDKGFDFDSDEYIEGMEEMLGMRQAELEEEEVVVKPKATTQRTSVVSAPVSREAPSTPDGDRGGTIRLTQEQREMAAVAGVTEKVYAENLLKIRRMKANGTYGGQQ